MHGTLPELIEILGRTMAPAIVSIAFQSTENEGSLSMASM